ncbi:MULTISPECIES: GNAT family N-acetyltransferase [Streptomyces]|uniref:GNAT family N-acetyltransferase n=1 Tax=Streptomyces TaxID=1883 RepID=UPI00069B7B2E|nr:GNAT family N-acetyltransferase [Streptomyces sp. SID7805]MYU51938.1 GNAT family N-acetyltransferase [Streptomyces sp. SID7805]
MLPRCREVQVRAGTEADLPALTELYNHYVRETPVTFDTEPFSPERRRPWLLSHPQDGPHRLLVAQETTEGVITSQEGAIASHAAHARTATAETAGTAGTAGTALLGYATSGPLRPKAAYATSVEVSVYCAPRAVGRGIGTLLYQALFDALADEAVHRAYAGITQPNEASARLHARFGFRHLGTYGEVGHKFGRYWDVAWYEKRLG